MFFGKLPLVFLVATLGTSLFPGSGFTAAQVWFPNQQSAIQVGSGNQQAVIQHANSNLQTAVHQRVNYMPPTMPVPEFFNLSPFIPYGYQYGYLIVPNGVGNVQKNEQHGFKTYKIIHRPDPAIYKRIVKEERTTCKSLNKEELTTINRMFKTESAISKRLCNMDTTTNKLLYNKDITI
nr:BV-like protein [Cotesia vestalis bracovirus]